MLTRLRDARGRPALRVRLVAALVVLGMVVLTAPVVLVPMVRWIVSFL